jgi:UDP-3-O-[3-hydroxymyristoyl] glucosamine N-acyltransferase
VFGDIPSGATFSGHPARPHRQFLRAQAALYRLAPIIDQVEQLVAKRAADA